MQVEVALERAEVAREIGRIEEARRLLGAALTVAPTDTRVLIALADIAFAQDDYDATLRLAGQVVHADPEAARGHELVALASSMQGCWDTAAEHAATAVRLLPDDPGALLMVAWLAANSPRKDRERARWAVREALALAPEDASAHCSAAEIYQRLLDIDEARDHIDAGLAIDPLHVDLLRMRAQSEFSRGRRAAALATLRGLLAHAPADAMAAQLLGEVFWRTLLRPAVWVWAFAGCYAAAAMWAPVGVLRVLSPLLFAALPLVWWRVFRTLGEQLPPGYLRARVRLPRVVLALAAVAVSGLLVDVGAVAMRSEVAGFVRLGGLVLVLGAAGAACGHLLIVTAWQRSRGDADPLVGFRFVTRKALALGLVFVVLVPILGLVRGWARQPAVFGALVAVLGIIVGTRALGACYVAWRRRSRRVALGTVILLVVLVCAGLAVWRGGGELVHGEIRAAVAGDG